MARNEGYRASAMAIRFVSVLGLAPLSALASGLCETKFRAEHEGSSWEFVSHQPLQGRTVEETVGSLRENFAHQGLKTFPIPDEGGKSRLGVIQPAHDRNPQVLLVAFVDKGAATLVIKLADSITDGSLLRADPEHMRSLMCGALASAATDRSRTEPAVANSGAADADYSRTAPPPDKPKARVLEPSVKFNAQEARAALLPGTNVITGTACARYSGQLVLASNLPVYLYPVTPYLTEIMSLIKKVRNEDTVEIDPEFQTARLKGFTNAKGQFRFAKLKPGEYMLAAHIDSRIERQREVDVGTAYTAAGPVAIVGKENYTTDYSTEAIKNVRVDGEGNTVKVRLSPPFKLFSGGHAGILGCSSL